MNIKILDSWLREYLKTKASPQKIRELLSLSSVSIERLERTGDDWLYDIEVTTNRVDLMSVIGIAREAAVVLSQEGIDAKFTLSVIARNVVTRQSQKIPTLASLARNDKERYSIEIRNNPKLVGRICTAVLEVKLADSPSYIKERLEASGIRSLNNLVDITNYVMREIGHPVHVFDYDRLTTKTLLIRESKKGEKIVTLDGKEHILPGGDIVADNGKGEIVDLLGVMGTENSVVTEKTKRILFFIDNNEPYHIRRTSMSLGIRSEAAVLNEKGVDPEIALHALMRGIDLYQKTADAMLISHIIDIYPNKPKQKTVTISLEKINEVIGVYIAPNASHAILTKLGFETKESNNKLAITVPTWRENDIKIPEDIIEEIARIYGYHRLPTILPPASYIESFNTSNNEFYWENRIKNALKYWGFTEVYTYSMVSENLYEGDIEDAVTIKNSLTNDMLYMRRTIVPSLLQVIQDNENRESIKIFELANVYSKHENDLPDEMPILAGVLKDRNASFYHCKGIIEQLLHDSEIANYSFKSPKKGGEGADMYIDSSYFGEIEILEEGFINFELNFEVFLKRANLKKVYKPIPKYPPIIEDIRVVIDPAVKFEKIVSTIKKQSDLVRDVSLLDIYENKKTFRIIYQHLDRNLTNEDVAPIREKIYSALEKELKAKIV